MQIHQQPIDLKNSTVQNAFAYADEEKFLIQKREDLFTVFYSLPAESLTMSELFRIPFNNKTNVRYAAVGLDYATIVTENSIAYFELDESN